MADDLSLLFRIRAENTQAKAAMAETRAAVAQLRQSFGTQLAQGTNIANQAFTKLGDNLNLFVGERLPLVGGAFVRISEHLRSFGSESAKSEKALTNVTKSIQSIATASGKTVPEITGFLSKFVLIEGQAKRDSAAVEFFGAALGAKLIPQLEDAGTELAGLAEESAGAGSALAGMAGPIGIAVLALAALAAGAVLTTKELFDLSKSTAEFEGHLFNLSRETGLAVETLSALEVEIKSAGGSLDTVAQAVFQFQRKLDDAQDPLSKSAEQFRKFGIATSDTETALRQTFAALAAMPEGFAQSNLAAEFFGARGGKQVLAVLKQMNGDLDEAINRLRDMGILITDSDARAAHKFNDELDLLNFQLRAAKAVIGEELLPAFTDIVHSITDIVRAFGPFLSAFAKINAAWAEKIADAIRKISIVVRFLMHDYEGLARAIKEAQDAQEHAPLSEPVKIPPTFLTPVPLPGPPTPQQAASEAINQSEEILAAVKRNAAQTNEALSELFQKGRRNREQETEGIIAENKKVLEAEQARIDALINKRQVDIKAMDEAQRARGEIIRRDSPEYQAATAELVKLFQERQDKENEFEVTSKALRAKAAKERADATRNQIANERDILVSEFDRTIADIEAQIKRGAKSEQDGLTIIEQLEQAKIDARLESLQKQKDVGFLTVQEQKDTDAELKKLQQEKDRLEDEQHNRRLERDRVAAERDRDILISNLETLVQLEQSAGERRIAAIQALADRRVISEEEAAREILKIRLDLVDDEIEATKAKLTAAGSITDKNERIKAEADLNNQIKILKDQRVTIEAEGNRAVDGARQKDIENERRYAEAIVTLRQRAVEVERDVAQSVINLLALNFARRLDIIRAQAKADIDEENRRNKQAQREITSLRHDVNESNRTREEKLQALLEIDELEETEADRHRLAIEEIRRRAALDEKNAEPLGRINIDLDNLKEFASIIENSIVPLGQILTNTFQQVADAIGETVQNWVLLGETGPAVMRKILAQALASIAAEAAVNAIKELALGFATLFFNPAESAAHFTAAALWASIGGVAAIAGRSVAGDLFKSKTSGGGATSPTSGGPSGQINPVTPSRNSGTPPPQRVILDIRSNDSHIVKVVKEDYRSGGKLREIILNDGGV